MTEKKSFLLYFDMYPHICKLPTDQRGALLSAIFEYAGEVVERDVAPEDVLDRYPLLSPATQMAFSFIAETVRRDTEKWREKHIRYVQAARARSEKKRTIDDDIRKYMD